MSILAPSSHILYREIQQREAQPYLLSSVNGTFATPNVFGFDRTKNDCRQISSKRDVRAHGFFGPELSKPAVDEMEPIEDFEHLDRILAHAKEISQPVVVDWMASWCRKCIYLKPKLEKLADEYDPKVKFYYVDVNKVPQALVKRGNISKMPTIQLWKDGEMKAEVIGGHKAWLVIEEVKEMINKFVLH